ncbi:HNH endonuclease [Streptomyces sp. NPDC046939]|uniref:HNH endonuclease signature motif containing protein n=1 Tax=Streptomyces sp. NPDC046939 TaxID=3155376 RepID=UPI0033F50489
MSGKYPREMLTSAAAESSSLVDLMRRVGAPMGGGPAGYLRKRLAHYGIDTSHFTDEPLPERPRRSYSAEVLADAAARSSSIREMFLHMGVPPEDGPYALIKQKLVRFGIDTRHFGPARGSTASTLFPEEEFTLAVAASRSLAGLLRELGEPPYDSSARAKAKRSIDVYGLSTEHFAGQAHRAGTTSPKRRGAADILVRRPPGSHRTRTHLLRRALDDLGVPRVCAECGQGEVWRRRRLVLEIDHINGDPLDDRRENLRHLCPNCHAFTRTWCRGGSRAR